MAFTAAIELGDSWQQVVTADGNEEFTLTFYAPWADVYGPRGNGNRFAELGEPLVTTDGTVDERLRLQRIIVSPTMGDREGCRYEQVYSSSNVGLKKKVPDLRSSWKASFNTQMEVKEVENEVSTTTVGVWDADLLTKIVNGEILKETVYYPVTTYNASYNSSNLNLTLYHNAIGKVNADEFFTQHREVSSGEPRFKDLLGNILFARSDLNGDKQKWFFSDFSTTLQGINNWSVNMEFMFKPSGWNGDLTKAAPGDPIFYQTTDFQPLFAEVKKLVFPDATVPGRT
jgi:hypothetical protein